ncbi:hypothetical protein HY621_01335 [Candidatus Uhrbacteria bacterium]|nr:hypothetical protein [Candidatus Uhrbacteria bacterium]
MAKMKRIAQGFMAGFLVFSFFGLVSVGSLYAQSDEGAPSELTEQELQQLKDLYSSPESSSGYDYSSGSASSLGGNADVLSSLLGGSQENQMLLASLLYMFDDYWWIPMALYFLVLLFIAFVLYASVFKKFKRFVREHAMVFSWNEAKKHIWFFVLITLIQVIIYAVLSILISMLVETNPFIPIPVLKNTIPYVGYYAGVLGIVLLFFFILFAAGTTKIALKFTDGARASIADLFTAITYLPKFILAALLYMVIILGPYVALVFGVWRLASLGEPFGQSFSIGLGSGAFFPSLKLTIGASVIALLLAIPVSHWILKFYLYYIAVIDKGVWPIKALKLASQYSKGAKTDIALFLVLLTAINMVGSNVPLMLGLFLTSPITSLAFVHAYRQLEKGATTTATE